jgi:hypothetical protein
MLVTTPLRPLSLLPAQHPRQQPHISSASGLVRVKSWWYVAADDEHHLARLAADPCNPAEPVELVRLLEDDLPLDAAARKLAKPDFETLATLPAIPGCPYGALLTLGSGSTATRQGALLLALDVNGLLSGRMARLDWTPLYARLRRTVGDLNIEGAFVSGAELVLLQRGNQRNPRNACIRYDWNQVVPWMVGKVKLMPTVKSIQWIDLGRVNTLALTLTDGAPLPNGEWAFCAVAENTTSTTDDGPCVASAIGRVDAKGVVKFMEQLQGSPKVEGIAVTTDGATAQVTLVTDCDNPGIASQLLQTQFPIA